jgi:hypothetical protein
MPENPRLLNLEMNGILFWQNLSKLDYRKLSSFSKIRQPPKTGLKVTLLFSLRVF